MDILFAFPVLLLAITIVVILGPGTVTTLLRLESSTCLSSPGSAGGPLWW